MIWILIIASLLLLAYPLDSIGWLSEGREPAILWTTLGQTLIKLSDQYVLSDGGVAYAYLNEDSDDTYVPAIRVDTGRKFKILNHRYFLEWIRAPARIVHYEPGSTLAESLNRLRETITAAT